MTSRPTGIRCSCRSRRRAAKKDCDGTPARDGSATRFRGVRIFDIPNIDERPCRSAASRPAAARTRTRSCEGKDDPGSVYIYVSGTVRAIGLTNELDEVRRRPGDRTANSVAVGGSRSSRSRSARRQNAAIVDEPRLFKNEQTGARQRPAERAGRRRCIRPASRGVRHRHQPVPRHHRLRGARPRGRRLRGQRPPDRHLRPGAARSGSTRSPIRSSPTGTARRSPTTARTSSSPTSGAAARRALPRDRPAQLGRRRDLRDRQPQARVPQLLQAAGGADRSRRTASRTSASLDPGPRPQHHGPGLVPGRRLARGLHQPEPTRRRSATSTADPLNASTLVFGGYWSTYWYNGTVYGSGARTWLRLDEAHAERQPDRR